MSVHGQGQAPQAGWYPDPRDPRSLRFWNGVQWTERTAPMVPPATSSVPYVPGRGSNTTAWVVVAAVIGALLVVGILAAIAIPVFLNQRERAADASATADAGISANDDAGISGSDGADIAASADASARSDVSTLALGIATWYVDSTGAPPAVGVSGGQYVVDGYPVGNASAGVVLGGVTGTGPQDWCVWVTNPEGDVKSFSYSAVLGLQNGTC